MSKYFADGPTLDPNDPWPDGTQFVYINDHYNAKHLEQALVNRPVEKIIQSFFCVYPHGHNPITWAPIYLRMLDVDLDHYDTIVETKSCFNFMIYKQRPMRTLALQLIESLGLTTDYYTLGTPGTMYQSRSFVDDRNDNYLRNNWNNYLAKEVFLPTATSLIIETLEPEWGPCMTYTEKTLYPILALTFPIWLGGYQQARYWNKLGFDTFDDIIDHSYQDIADPENSMRHALASNRRLLTDVEHAANLRQQMMARLLENRRYVIKQPFDKMITDNINSVYPEFDKIVRRYIRIP